MPIIKSQDLFERPLLMEVSHMGFKIFFISQLYDDLLKFQFWLYIRIYISFSKYPLYANRCVNGMYEIVVNLEIIWGFIEKKIERAMDTKQNSYSLSD